MFALLKLSRLIINVLTSLTITRRQVFVVGGAKFMCNPSRCGKKKLARGNERNTNFVFTELLTKHQEVTTIVDHQISEFFPNKPLWGQI